MFTLFIKQKLDIDKNWKYKFWPVTKIQTCAFVHGKHGRKLTRKQMDTANFGLLYIFLILNKYIYYSCGFEDFYQSQRSIEDMVSQILLSQAFIPDQSKCSLCFYFTNGDWISSTPKMKRKVAGICRYLH